MNNDYFSDPFVPIIGISNRGLAGGGISPSRFDKGITYVWILSSALEQSSSKRGRWDDTAEWVDTNVWYD